ncbi:hypothetical protein Lpp14_08211 [Lacticaseibacillus paracasei subsp. paracasei Lpp14]|uniref:Uncharacterized protein n=1 Tax=Lacticaseibacillus paracasei subsp. paracasei Lpp14 TaxID=1256204 RepID=A0A829GQB7_LACPA|nr:hypothetical protein Lpp14_08211 [Lacticaseibacillus paracasei subsp. paracasei Lpp14]
MKHKFARGFFVGTLMTLGAIAGSVFAFKKTISNLWKLRSMKLTITGVKLTVSVSQLIKVKQHQLLIAVCS